MNKTSIVGMLGMAAVFLLAQPAAADIPDPPPPGDGIPPGLGCQYDPLVDDWQDRPVDQVLWLDAYAWNCWAHDPDLYWMAVLDWGIDTATHCVNDHIFNEPTEPLCNGV